MAKESAQFTIKQYKKKSIICLENTRVLDCLYLIQSGQVEKRINFYEKEEIEILKEGDTFGLISCLTRKENVERITTLTDCMIIEIKHHYLIPFLSQKRDVFLKIIQYYSNKLRNLDRVYTELSGQKNDPDSVEMIAQAIHYFQANSLPKLRNYAYLQYSKYCRFPQAIEQVKNTYHLENLPEIDLKTGNVYQKDEIIFLEQEHGENFYFIEKGKIKISHIYQDREIILSILNEGEFFGEMSILNRKKRMATAIVFDECKLMTLNKDNFMESLGDKILKKIFTSLASRLYHTYRRVINLHYKNPVARLYDCIDYLLSTKQGVNHEKSFHFYFAFEELKRMADIIDVPDKQVQEFLRDDNIRFNYGEMVIIDIDEFYFKLRRYTGKE